MRPAHNSLRDHQNPKAMNHLREGVGSRADSEQVEVVASYGRLDVFPDGWWGYGGGDGGCYGCMRIIEEPPPHPEPVDYGGEEPSIPTGETTLENAWSGLIPTAYKWRARLSGGNFVGRQVQEANGGGDVDTCWYPESQYAAMTGPSGGDWEVDSQNEYGDDTVGLHWLMVDYYRGAGRAPCQFETNQIMKINRPNTSSASYKTNRLKMGMTATTVWSHRDGHAVSKSY